MAIKEKGPCAVCKTVDWKAESLYVSGIECLLFVCGGCGVMFKGKQEEMDYWLKLKNRPKIAQPLSTNVVLEVNQGQQ